MLDKLKHEWKTLVVALAATLIGGYDEIVAAGLDWTPIVPEKYQHAAPFVLGMLMLGLRRYRPM